MESHVLNTYHRARYGLHARVSSSSDSSCAQTSPEYPAVEPWSNTDETKSSIKVEEDSSESSSDNEDVLPDHTYGKTPDQPDLGQEYYQEVMAESDDDYEVVVDDEPDPEPLIQVYAVDPNLDIDTSDDDEAGKDFSIDLDGPVVTNVDEFFIKHKDKVLEEPVVNNVDEYFIKNTSEMPVVALDEFFAKDTPGFLVTPLGKQEKAMPEFALAPETVTKIKAERGTSPDPNVIPHIEHIKRFLLEDMPCPKLQAKTVQRSCSLPHSPAHFSYLDVDDARTSLSFEDLNLDLADFSFDEGKDKLADAITETDEAPRTLTEEDVNSFLITEKKDNKNAEPVRDDMSQLDMEIECPVESEIPEGKAVAVPDPIPDPIPELIPKEPIPIVNEVKSNVLDFCVEKAADPKVRKVSEVKEADDFVDVESLNDTVIPVLEATNVSSLLEQFEATEKLNKVGKKEKIKGLANGMRLQDAAVQLNKNKMRQIMMTTSSTVKKPQNGHFDHDYCSPKKRHSLPAIRGGQSLLKPDVVSSNNKILNSRHRSCKNKKIIYSMSSDDEAKNSDKPSAKAPLLSNHRKKLSSELDKSNISVISNKASKASDNCSQSSSGSIKLTIKNKSKVILKLNCDGKKDVKDNTIDVVKKEVNNVKIIKPLDDSFNKSVNNSIANVQVVVNETRPIDNNNSAVKGDFYTALFNDKQGVHITLPEPLIVKETKPDETEKLTPEIVVVAENKPQKKKLNLQEYKMRRDGVNSNANSRTVSPEAIFPEIHVTIDKNTTKTEMPSPTGIANVKTETRETNDVFDPIKEARKILMITKKHKAEALRKRDEDFVMSKIPKVENLKLQPLISDAEMMKITGIVPDVLPQMVEKPKLSADYVEIVLVSVGTNTDDNIFKELQKSMELEIRTLKSPTHDKSGVNFKIGKKGDCTVLKQNVFDSVKKDRNQTNDKSDKRTTSPIKETKIDKERFKDITATIKSVEKQVDKKISSNSLFASIQDVVMKKAPEDKKAEEKPEERKSKSVSRSPIKKKTPFFKTKSLKTIIIRDFDKKLEHGEDKIILHLEKNRKKPTAANMNIQTDTDPDFIDLADLSNELEKKISADELRQRKDSDMSLSSVGSPNKENKKRSIERSRSKDHRSRSKTRTRTRSKSKDQKSRSRDRYDRYRRRSRSTSRRRRRTSSRSRSRSIDRRRYRRSVSPYRNKRSRSPYRRRNYRSRSRSEVKRSPLAKKTKQDECQTPPRKPTVSESSDSSSSSGSSSSSSSRSRSRSRSKSRSRSRSNPRRSASPYRKPYRRSYSSDGNNKPVEERRIVFVGKLEKDMTKSKLRGIFSKHGPVIEVTLHTKDNGSRYGFVTYRCGRDAWSAVAAAASLPQYDVGFGGRRAFCRQRYADLDGLEAEYSEAPYHTSAPRQDDMSFEQMLLEMKKKLSQRKKED